MWQKFCRWLLYRHLGWKKEISVEHPDKYIICLAPHPSNWDMLLGQAYAGAEGYLAGEVLEAEASAAERGV